ncbi:hypothetical protein QBE55_13815 [Eubacteriales bacterium mix99]|nr:hypothetical protein [Clostridiales bacterium]
MKHVYTDGPLLTIAIILRWTAGIQFVLPDPICSADKYTVHAPADRMCFRKPDVFPLDLTGLFFRTFIEPEAFPGIWEASVVQGTCICLPVELTASFPHTILSYRKSTRNANPLHHIFFYGQREESLIEMVKAFQIIG